MPGEYSTARAATALSVLALLSPIAGMAAEVALAWRYGVSTVADAYRIGSVLVLMGQQLLVLQILPHILVPVFARCSARDGVPEAWRAAQGVGNVFLLASAVIGAAVFIWPRPAVWMLAEGLRGEARADATLFIRWLGLAYAPLVITGTATALLYSQRIFWLPAAAQLLRNLLVAAAILIFPGRGGGPLLFATLGSVVLGAVLTVARLVPLARRDGARFTLQLGLDHPEVIHGIALSIPLVGVFLAGQWSPIVINRALSSLSTGSVATFGYAFKMGLLVALGPLSLATVLFPRFAEEHSSAAWERLESLGTRGLRMGLFLAVPVTACLIALRGPVVALLFERGAFGTAATTGVARLVGVLLLSTPAVVIAAHAQKMLYARQQTWLPTLILLANCVGLALLCPTIAGRWGADGVAILYTALSSLGAASLLVPLYAGSSFSELRQGIVFSLQLTGLGAASGWVGAMLGAIISHAASSPSLSSFLTAVGGCVGACAAYLSASVALSIPEAVACASFARWQSVELRRRMFGVARSG